MSHLGTWLCMSVAGFLYWATAYHFAWAGIDHFAGPVWFGGIALLVHWLSNRASGAQEQS